MNQALQNIINKLDVSIIPEQRKKVLDSLTEIIQQKKDSKTPINLNFICTHNSRRSHLSQIWMQTLASYFKIDNVFCYSGGTEATAMAIPAVEALKSQGFNIEVLANSNNPIYTIKYNQNCLPIIGFSKEYAHPFNPTSNFIAIMTCSQADEGCPLVLGAEQKIALTFEDPKLYDGTALQNEKYLERSIQMATELYYLLSNLK